MKNLIKTLVVLALISLAGALFAQNKHALFIVGDYSGSGIPSEHLWNNGDLGASEEWEEFWNDAYLYWEMLTGDYQDGGFGYENNFTKVLFADGQDYQPPGYAFRYLSPPNTIINNGAATKENLVNYLVLLANGNEDLAPLSNDDFLFIWTMGHGGYSLIEDDFVMYLYDDENADYITAFEFSTLVNSINAGKKVIFM
jgi:hypothetical protein